RVCERALAPLGKEPRLCVSAEPLSPSGSSVFIARALTCSADDWQTCATPLSWDRNGSRPAQVLGYHRPMRAADALMEALKAEGVRHIFGIPGGANLPIYDAVHDAEITHIQERKEQGAGHRAGGYAKGRGR